MVELLRWLDESWWNGWVLAAITGAAFKGAQSLLETLRPNAALEMKAFQRGHDSGMRAQREIAAELRKEGR